MHGGMDLEQIFGIKQLSIEEDYRRSIFCLTLKSDFMSCEDRIIFGKLLFIKRYQMNMPI